MNAHDVVHEPEHERSQLLFGRFIPQIHAFRSLVQIQGVGHHFAVELGFVPKMVIASRHVGTRTPNRPPPPPPVLLAPPRRQKFVRLLL